MSQLDKPNVVLPLANTYNERGIVGYTNTVTNAIDQRKVNCWYEPSVNPATGGTTHRIAKRPGVTGSNARLASNVVQNMLFAYAGSSFNTVWVFGSSGSAIIVGDASGNNTIVSSLAFPLFIDAMAISGVNTIIMQGGTAGTWYASAIGSWTQIVDADYPSNGGVNKNIPMDGYLFSLDASNRIWNSNLNDLSTWGSTSFITKQIQQDIPFGLMKLGKRIIAAGAETLEQFVNVGNSAGSPLEVVPSGFQKIGIGFSTSAVPGNYYATLGGRIYFLGQSPNASATTAPFRKGGIYAFDGNALEKVSTPFIDKILIERGFFGIEPISILGRNGIAIDLGIVGGTSFPALLYFPEWKEWFEWNSTQFRMSGSSGGIFRSGATGAGTRFTYTFVDGADTWQDNTVDYTMTVQFKLPAQGNERKFIRWMGVKGDTARSASSLTVQLSRDDYQSFETARTIDMTQVSKKNIYRCGAATDLAVRLSHTGNLDCRLEQFLARID